ncbi:zinc finger protein 184-like [Belonocnema kinseyi]|uniref:zinc finger protein 184-like n=1 Tax=Belonocnema kinseyi TaxID=2817044 RepID=UPI00143CE205|nr:zinc finger protein 184-like [Belonocnema kinseyi]
MNDLNIKDTLFTILIALIIKPTQNQLSASTSTKNLWSDSKKSTGKRSGGPYSVLHCIDFMEFEPVFWKQAREKRNISDANTLNCRVVYENDTTLEIKEENIQDQEICTSQKCETKLSNANIREVDVFGGTRKMPTHIKEKVQKSRLEKTHTCEKCARSYKRQSDLNSHRRFECDVMPQFRCEYCTKRFKRNTHLRRHIDRVHQKSDLNALQTKYNCNKCSRSYSSSDSLNRHKRLEHAVIKPQFICDYCGQKTKEKSNLSQHITAKHINLNFKNISNEA